MNGNTKEMGLTGQITLVNTIAERLKESRERLGLSQDDLAARSGVSQGTIGNIEAGIRKRPREIVSIANALGVLPEWLEKGHGPRSKLVSEEETLPWPRSIRVPLMSAAASMGEGAEQALEDVVVGSLDLSPQWVSQHLRSSKPDQLRFLSAYGDSMAPTFSSGDVLLVDTGARSTAIDGIYVISAQQRLFVKRVRQRLDGSIEISSDNPAVKTTDALNGDHQVDVIGRVVWVWNGRKV